MPLVLSTFGFTLEQRIRKSKEYATLRQKGRRKHSDHFILVFLDSNTEASRLGITVTRKIGCAVVRNRIKRHLREFFRTHQALFSRNIDLSIIVKNGSGDLSYAMVREELSRSLLSSSLMSPACLKKLSFP